MPNRISEIAAETMSAEQAYLDSLGWDANPFVGEASLEEYVLPSPGTIADIASKIENYTGPIVIHAPYSGVGKTTLLKMLLQEYSDSHQTLYIGEHNVTAYELAAIIADDLGVGKSSSTKFTERKIRNADLDQPVLIGVDEFGLNDPDTIHVLQHINDTDGFKLIITGMSEQWAGLSAGVDGDGNVLSENRAFARRVSHTVKLAGGDDAAEDEPYLSPEQARELYQRRVASVTDVDHDDYAKIPLDPLTDEAFETVYRRSDGIPAVMISAFAELIALGPVIQDELGTTDITEHIADQIDYSDPHAQEPGNIDFIATEADNE